MTLTFASLGQPYFWPVEIPIPVDGKYEKLVFDAEFRYMDREQTKELLDEMSGSFKAQENMESIPEEESIQKPEQFTRKIMSGWRNMPGGDGNDVEFTEENFSLLLKDRGACSAINMAWLQSITSGQEKN